MTPKALTALIDATWPATRFSTVGPWTIREGAGGGSRVSAATARDVAADAEIETAEAAMRALGQTPLFMLREDEEPLDRALEARGYQVKDPVTLYTTPARSLAVQPPPVTCFEVWPPVASQLEIWAKGGIGRERIAIMDRAKGPKTTLLGRLDDTPAGTLFVALHDDVAMVHAVEIAPAFRRRGLGRFMMQGAATWARDNNAQTLAVLVTKANTGANALYSSLGMSAAAGYHYRIHPEA